MPTSRKQIKANRQNAKKSTGPKTPRGKAAASRNALKFGLYTHDAIINSPHLRENPEEYHKLVDSLTRELNPRGAFQKALVLKIANCLWRSRRAIAAETACINDNLCDIDPDDDLRWQLHFKDVDPDDTRAVDEIKKQIDQKVQRKIGMESIPDQTSSANILRYEMRLDRQMTRAYKLLRHLQLADAAVPGEDDIIRDSGPFRGLADLEADPFADNPENAPLPSKSQPES